MSRRDFTWIDVLVVGVLLGGAAAVGGECYRRGVEAGTLGLGIAAVVLFFLLGRPWQLQPAPGRINRAALGLAAVSLLVGLVSDLLLPFSIAWTALLWAWLSGRVHEEARPPVFRLLLLTLFVFPWVDVDLKPVNWAMRISSAFVSEHVLSWCGLPTTREGTVVQVAGQRVEITEDCGGDQTVHAMLIVGLAAAYVHVGPQQAILPWLPVLCAFAWLANSVRVMMVCLAAVYCPSERYFVWVHDGGGWLVVALMIGLCMGCFAVWNRYGATFRRWGVSWPHIRWPNLGKLRREGTLTHLALWGLLAVCVGVGLLARAYPLPDAQRRLEQLPTSNEGHPCREVALSEAESRRAGAAKCVKRVYRLGGREFLVTVIDGTRNRRAVHDPTYCWTITHSSEQSLPGGSGMVLRVVEEGIEKEVLFWFSNGVSKHASPARHLLQATIRRATLGCVGDEPVLVLVEPIDPAPVNWFRVLDGCPWLMEL